MENIRCLIADIPHIILADVIQEVTERRPGMEIVGRVNNHNDLVEIVKERDVDVLILSLEDRTVFESLKDLFESAPNVVTVGVIEHGKRICIGVNDIGPDDFISLVKQAVHKKH